MSPLAYAFVLVVCFVIVGMVLVHLWPDAQPWIQNLTGGDSMTFVKSLMP